MPENQQVVFLSDGGEEVRQVQEDLHPNREHGIDWFPISMRLTVLPPQTKALQAERPDEGVAASKPIESVQHRCGTATWTRRWTASTACLYGDLIRRPSDPADQWAVGIAELRTYLRNHRGSIPNYGERYRQGETIRTAQVESTIHPVVSRRLVKQQPMQGTRKGGALAVTDTDEGPP